MKKKIEKVEVLKSELLGIDILTELGVHFGHKINLINWKMKSYILGNWNLINVIDLNKTLIILNKVLNLIYNFVSKGNEILFVCNKPNLLNNIINFIKDCKQHYINKKWFGGIISNWISIKKTITKYKEFEKDFEKQKTNKKLKFMFLKKKKHFNYNFQGIKNMKRLPAAIVILCDSEESLAAKEAKQNKIPVIGITDTNSNINNIDYPVPGNNDSKLSILFLYKLLCKACNLGLLSRLKKLLLLKK